jgi:hypothetical protein
MKRILVAAVLISILGCGCTIHQHVAREHVVNYSTTYDSFVADAANISGMDKWILRIVAVTFIARTVHSALCMIPHISEVPYLGSLFSKAA